MSKRRNKKQKQRLHGDKQMYLGKLKQILKDKANDFLYPCIEDLVANGLTLARFSNEDPKPSRQDITQYMAAWFRYIGVSSDECRDWLIVYCIEMLSPISSSSPSRIRHSTKSNIKYIYESDVPFDCRCENNQFKARCERNCPVYVEMSEKAKEGKARGAVQSYEPEPEPKRAGVEIERLSVKEIYSDQFGKAMEIVNNHIKKGVAKKDIVALLNDGGFKTRTGRTWSYAILANELKKQDKNTRKAGEQYHKRYRKTAVWKR